MLSGRGTAQFVVFRVEQREYALPLEHVLHVLRMVAVTPVPEAPAWLLGVINWHGRVIPVMDLRVRLGLPALPAGLGSPLLLFQNSDGVAALLADEVVEVLSPPPQARDRPDERLGAGHALTALLRWGDRLILVLDPARLWDAAVSPALPEAL
jgi:purine-binding chemotaxis protein CheW